MDDQVVLILSRLLPNPILLSLIFSNEIAAFITMNVADKGRGVNLSPLLRSGKFSDLQLSCEGRDFAVHKAILCSQSRVISAECEGNFEVSSVVHWP